MFLARPRAAHSAILGRPEERLFPARRHSQIHELSFVDPHLIQSNSCSNTPPRSDDLYRQSDITILNGSSNTPPRSDSAILGRPEERLFPARRHSQIHELSFADPHLIQSNSCSNTPSIAIKTHPGRVCLGPSKGLAPGHLPFHESGGFAAGD
jgi:hypothetical protein